MNPLLLIVIIPVLAGICGYFIYRLRNEFNFIGAALTLYYAIYLFIVTRSSKVLYYQLFNIKNINWGFYLDQFNSIIILLLAIIFALILFYSIRYLRDYQYLSKFNLFLMFAIAITYAIILSNNLVLLFFLLITLSVLWYIFLLASKTNSAFFANQLFLTTTIFNIIISLGIYIFIYETNISSLASKLPIISSKVIIALLLIFVGIIGKTFIIPIHFRISNQSPLNFIIFLPLIADKIASVYLLIRLLYFVLNINLIPLLQFVILIIGGLSTVYLGVKAIKAKEIFQLLNYHSIIQLGLVFIGIGCGNIFGLASAIYHLINYLTCQPALLLTTSSFEYWTKSTNFESVQGLASKMPITFIVFSIMMLAIIGIPPLNGFFSRWLLFQGLLQFNNIVISLAFTLSVFLGGILFLVASLRGLLAFWGKETKYSQRIRDPGFTMTFSPMLLALLAIISGVFANSFSWQTILFPTLSQIFNNVSRTTPYHFGIGFSLLLISLITGIIIYLIKLNAFKVRSAA
ncbi:MAG: proton-conducting transporter membrane subunit [candidate division WOR-3 bacterium]